MSGRCILANCAGKEKQKVIDHFVTTTKLQRSYVFSENKVDLPTSIHVMKYHVNAWYEELKSELTQRALVIIDADACPLTEKEWHRFMKQISKLMIDVKCVTLDPSSVPSWIMNYCAVLTVPNV
jgi:hypothetical protein